MGRGSLLHALRPQRGPAMSHPTYPPLAAATLIWYALQAAATAAAVAAAVWQACKPAKGEQHPWK